MEGNLVLILNDHRIEANKEKLATKSRYFASLFSGNFNDSNSKEHTINYDISLFILKSFVEWIHDDDECEDFHCHSIKQSMTKFMGDNFTDLIYLLQLSVLFTVDELKNDIIDIIILFWLVPEKVVDIWLLTQELCIKELQDICLSVCLERFEELPPISLVDLPTDSFLNLLQNVNVTASVEYLKLIRKEWLWCHEHIPHVAEERHPRFIQATVGYVQSSTSKVPSTDACLYTWDGTNFSKFMQLRNDLLSERWMSGMQVTGRGFSIYTVGGEMGIGTGKFNNYIWRYCLISKKWYYYAKLPVPRRHMIVAFMDHKLVIVGGVGRHRLKLFTVDILDTHRGTWSSGARIPEDFIQVPYYCVMDGKLFVIKSELYIYYPEEDYWATISINQKPCLVKNGACLAYDALMFLDSRPDRSAETVLLKIDVLRDEDCETDSDDSLTDSESTDTDITDTEITDAEISDILSDADIMETEILYEDDDYQFRYAEVAGIGVVIVSNRCNKGYRYLRVHTELRRDLESTILPRIQCFNFIDPDTLYNTV
ncbi:uncharacterized protein LOC117224998 [Megalopta genalis]|uniref:uncharacterized protein LOC117224998 n=1 Tax=Megalopta genalis TaxID=115081 RepID=UPI003FCF2478